MAGSSNVGADSMVIGGHVTAFAGIGWTAPQPEVGTIL
jgi:hypothetical protein